jgi:hypothetical protein
LSKSSELDILTYKEAGENCKMWSFIQHTCRNAYKSFFAEPEEKRDPGRPKRRWEDIRMDLRDMEKSVSYIRLAHSRVQ